MSGAIYRSPRADWSFSKPDNLQAKFQADGEATRITLTDLRDPRNFFGFKVVLASQPQGSETLAAAISRLSNELKAGAAKRNFVEDQRARGELLGQEAQLLEARYVLEPGRLEYQDPDGKTHAVGEEPIQLRVKLLATLLNGFVVAAWLVADADRFTALDPIFQKVLQSARWQPPPHQ